MNPSRRKIISALPALSALSASQWTEALAQEETAEREANAPAMPMVGSYVQLPTVTLLDGSTFNARQAKERISVVYWWASTCPFCALQSPEMQKFWQANQGQELQLLTLSTDKTMGDAAVYLQKKGYTVPTAWVNAAVNQALPKPKGLPITLVLRHNGTVLQAEKGQMFPEDVAQLAKWLSS
jgi:hypothetical protein